MSHASHISLASASQPLLRSTFSASEYRSPVRRTLLLFLMAIGLGGGKVWADGPISTPAHPATYQGVTSYVNAAGVVVATSTWTLTTSGGTNPGNTGFASIRVTIRNLTSACTLAGGYFGMAHESPRIGTLLTTWGLTSTSTYSVEPGASYNYTGSTQTITLPSRVNGIGLYAGSFRSPSLSSGALPYSFLSQNNTCFASVTGPAPPPESNATLTANPNPIPAGQRRTTLTWSAPGINRVELRVGSATGPAMTVGGSTGTAQTDDWVADGMIFFLVDASNARTLVTTTVNIAGTTAPRPEPPTGTIIFAANPNPLPPNLRRTVLSWSAPGVARVQIRVSSRTGPIMTAGASSGSAETGDWVAGGLEFFLLNEATQQVLASVTMASSGTGPTQPTITFAASPNPIQAGAPAKTTLTWNAPGVARTEIRVGRADGPVMADGEASGSAETGDWVSDGLRFYLIGLNPTRTLASVEVKVLDATVGEPEIGIFDVAPNLTNTNSLDAPRLLWNTRNAVTANVDQGVGRLPTLDSRDYDVTNSGLIIVPRPGVGIHVYTLTATNSNGVSVRRTATLTVAGPVSFTISPNPINYCSPSGPTRTFDVPARLAWNVPGRLASPYSSYTSGRIASPGSSGQIDVTVTVFNGVAEPLFELREEVVSSDPTRTFPSGLIATLKPMITCSAAPVAPKILSFQAPAFVASGDTADVQFSVEGATEVQLISPAGLAARTTNLSGTLSTNILRSGEYTLWAYDGRAGDTRLFRIQSGSRECPSYRPPDFDRRVLPIAFNNNGASPVDVRLYHPADPTRPFGTYTIPAGANNFLLPQSTGVGNDWGIRVGDFCPVSVGSTALYYAGRNWQAAGNAIQGLTTRGGIGN